MLSKQAFTIEMIKQSDINNLLPLVVAYLDFYKITLDRDKLKQFLIELCNRPEKGCIWLAQYKEHAVGFATVYKTYSTFQAKPALILNDLYVLPNYRRLGIGKRLFNTCKQLYQTGNYAYLEWMSHANNEEAKQFYLKQGARETQWKVFNV